MKYCTVYPVKNKKLRNIWCQIEKPVSPNSASLVSSLPYIDTITCLPRFKTFCLKFIRLLNRDNLIEQPTELHYKPTEASVSTTVRRMDDQSMLLWFHKCSQIFSQYTLRDDQYKDHSYKIISSYQTIKLVDNNSAIKPRLAEPFRKPAEVYLFPSSH